MNHSNAAQTSALARREDILVQELTNEVLVYDLKRHKAHCLNQSAAFVWKHCDGKTSAASIAELMGEEWSTTVSEDVVWLALKQLARAALLEKIPVRPEGELSSSRRAAIRKMGLAAAMVPLVTSIIAPTAAAGASVIVPPTCQNCRKKSDGICPGECAQVVGSCFDNSGCGGGQLVTVPKRCWTCEDCFTNHVAAGGDGTISWKAPPVTACP